MRTVAKRVLSVGSLIFGLSTLGAIINHNNYSNSAVATLMCAGALFIINLWETN